MSDDRSTFSDHAAQGIMVRCGNLCACVWDVAGRMIGRTVERTKRSPVFELPLTHLISVSADCVVRFVIDRGFSTNGGSKPGLFERVVSLTWAIDWIGCAL